MRRPGDAVPGREAQAHVLADRADPAGGPQRARRVGRGGRREHRLAVLVEVPPEPGAGVVVRVGQDAARADLANARAARVRGHEAVGAPDELGAAVEHERA